jgi:hypothetical protein
LVCYQTDPYKSLENKVDVLVVDIPQE